eukprot:COSAG06_NODE_45427_length_355_cov_0.574219_1_plen_81_part_01
MQTPQQVTAGCPRQASAADGAARASASRRCDARAASIGQLRRRDGAQGSPGTRRSRVAFFKQKTAYEIMSGDWSSDVCSSD